MTYIPKSLLDWMETFSQRNQQKLDQFIMQFSLLDSLVPALEAPSTYLNKIPLHISSCINCFL